jgi:acyl-CoA thioester hydrolase
MPLEHVQTFCVRHYECNSHGYVTDVNYLRYMEEAAFGASAAAGYDLARYDAMGRLWLIRETDIEYLRPLRYGDSVEIKTWVADFRRVRSRRAYEFKLAGSGERVARASTDWVFVESTTGRPATIPPEMIVAFFPEGLSDTAPPRVRMHAASPLPPGVFKQRRRVNWQDIDPANHVNNSMYLAYVEDCAVQALAVHGWPLARLWSEGYYIFARRHRVQYLQPALLDDELELAMWITSVRHASVMRHTTITRVSDGTLLARVDSTHVWVDLATQKPTRIPPAILADFAPKSVDG